VVVVVVVVRGRFWLVGVKFYPKTKLRLPFLLTISYLNVETQRKEKEAHLLKGRNTRAWRMRTSHTKSEHILRATDSEKVWFLTGSESIEDGALGYLLVLWQN
jgi:hypothetical protein